MDNASQSGTAVTWSAPTIVPGETLAPETKPESPTRPYKGLYEEEKALRLAAEQRYALRDAQAAEAERHAKTLERYAVTLEQYCGDLRQALHEAKAQLLEQKGVE